MKSVLIAAFLIGVMLAACGGGGQAVATVNGTEISAEYMASLRESYGRTLNVNTEQFREDLGSSIIRLAIEQEAETEYGLVATDADIAERLADPPAPWQSHFDELAADTDVTDVMLDAEAKLSLLRDRVAAELIRDESGFIEQAVAETPQVMTGGCVRHILVATRAEAEDVMRRLEAGEDFAALAAEVSLDTQTGGDYAGGCPTAFAGFVTPFAFSASTGPLNEPIGPVETTFGFHVLLVEQRIGPPTVEQVRADPILYLPGSTVSEFFTTWFNAAVRDSEITVAATVGTWSDAGLGIVPPGQ